MMSIGEGPKRSWWKGSRSCAAAGSSRRSRLALWHSLSPAAATRLYLLR